MIKEILPDIYCLKIPLPNNPLGALNSYLIKGGERNLLIDTGFNWPECKAALVRGLDTLCLNPSELDFFITHVHGDHSGLVYDLAGDDSVVYSSKIDAELLQNSFTLDYWRKIDQMYTSNGFPVAGLGSQANQIKSFISGHKMNFIYVDDGTILSFGDYHFTCVMTPGHSPGHVCLYEANKKILISGDHILPEISPNITAWDEVGDSLGAYLESLEKVNNMEIRLVLPGHRGLITDCQARIAELKHHHQLRLHEIIEILQVGAQTAYQVASQMTWDMSYKNWDEFPMYQKWFATGEAMAHLEHLIARNDAKKIYGNGMYLYQKLK